IKEVGIMKFYLEVGKMSKCKDCGREISWNEGMEITNNGFQCLSCKIKELKQQNERYRKALEFYADDENYESKNAMDSDYIEDYYNLIELDKGELARQ